MSPLNRIKDPEEKKRAREELARGYLQEWAGNLEKQIGEPFIGGAKLHVADLKVFVTLTPILNGKIDHVPTDVFKSFPKLLRLYEATKTHPKVAAWYARK